MSNSKSAKSPSIVLNRTSAADVGLPAWLPSERPSKKPRHADDRPSFVPPRSRNGSIKQDLSDFGFSASEVKEMMSRDDPPWDPAMPQYTCDGAVNAVKVPREKRPRVKKKAMLEAEIKKQGDYQSLCLRASSNWVLFDPNKGFPAHFGDPSPRLERLATFKAGNLRILEYNIETQSVRVRSTPHLLEEKAVEYTDTGPKVVEVAVAPVKKPRGRPRKYPRPSEGGPDAGTKRRVSEAELSKAVAKKPRTEEDGDEIVVKMESKTGSDDTLTTSDLTGD